MKKIVLLLVLCVLTQIGYAQTKIDTNKSGKNMQQTSMLGLRTVIYKVGDIAKATEWYTKAFGIEPYFNETFYVGFNIGGFELGLQPEKKPTTDKTESVVAFWGVDDIQKEYDRLIKLGATDNEKPFNVGGELMTATLKDPFGNIIGLIYNPHFKIKD